MSKNTKWVILIVLVVLAVPSIIGAIASTQETKTGYSGITYTRDAYIKGCSDGYYKSAGEAIYTQAEINKYCGCTWDKGVAEYGAEGWSTELINMGDTFTPKMSEFVNQCILII